MYTNGFVNIFLIFTLNKLTQHLVKLKKKQLKEADKM